MRRPKRHQSRVQIRCDHHKKRAQMLREIHEEYVKQSASHRTNLYCQIDNQKNKIESLQRELSLLKLEQTACQAIINKAAQIDFRYCENGYYALEVRFNGDFMGAMSRYGEPREYVAQHVARQIENQIMTSRFIESARANRRREYERVRPDWLCKE